MSQLRMSLNLLLAVALLTWGMALAAPGGAPMLAAAQAAASSVPFIENAGQWPAEARFQAWGGPGTLWLAQDTLWLTVVKPRHDAAPAGPRAFEPWALDRPAAPEIGVNLKLSFVDASPAVQLVPAHPLTTTVSYFLGNEPAQWRPAVPVWGEVRYVGLYPDVDLVLSGAGGQWTWQLRGTAGAVPRLRIEGAEGMALDGASLRLTPGAFDTNFSLCDAFVAQFRSDGASLVYSTFLGGTMCEDAYSVAIDGAGRATVGGVTSSADFPVTPGAFDTSFDGSTDAFVIRLNPTGSGLVYGTLVGGSEYDLADVIAVDAAGRTCATGHTTSNNFPTSPGAYDRSFNGENDVFVVKLNPAGSQLVYGTFVGSPGWDLGNGIAVNSMGYTHVTGQTQGSEFPTTPLSFDPTHNGGTDVFVLKLDTTPYTPHVVAPIEQPSAGANISGTVTLSGFAIDLGSSSGTGVDAVHIYLDGPHGTGTFIGAATYGLNRPDVAAQYGTRFAASGWERTWDTTGVVPGIHWLYLYAHRTTANAWTTMPAHPVVVAGGHAAWLPLAP